MLLHIDGRRVWIYQKDNQNPYIEKQTKQMAKRKSTKGKKRSTKHTYKTKDRVTWTPLKTGGEHRCSGRVSSSYSASGNRRVNLDTNQVISREWGKDWVVLTTSGTYPRSFVTQIFHNNHHNNQSSHGGDPNIFEVMTSTLPKGTLGSVATLLAATLYQGEVPGGWMSSVLGLPTCNNSYNAITNTAWVRVRLYKLQKGAASDNIYQLLAHGRWFFPGTPASSTIKTGRHDIAEILLKVTLSTINQIKSNV